MTMWTPQLWQSWAPKHSPHSSPFHLHSSSHIHVISISYPFPGANWEAQQSPAPLLKKCWPNELMPGTQPTGFQVWAMEALDAPTLKCNGLVLFLIYISHINCVYIYNNNNNKNNNNNIIYYIITSSAAQGGGGSFKNRKPTWEIGCCESQMAERIHWWTERWLELCFLEWLQWLQWSPGRSPHPQLLDVVWCVVQL